MSKAGLRAKSHAISRILLEPFKSLLSSKTHIIFVPFPGLQAFSFSTLRLDGQEIVFTHAVSQTPSLQYLANAALRQGNPAKAVCFIANPHTSTIGSRDPTPMAAICAIAAAKMRGTTAIRGDSLDSESFADNFRSHDIVHVGTHGNELGSSPMQSSISLARDFRVIDLVGLGSNASLVIFAACLTGLGRATAGNDVLGFSHVVLQSGARAYMGALWKISDWVTMVLMYAFHKRLSSADFDGSIA